MAKIGDIVTITVDHPAGTFVNVLDEIGVIYEYDAYDRRYCVKTGNPTTTEYWFDETEFRPATAEEIADRLRYVLMERRIV